MHKSVYLESILCDEGNCKSNEYNDAISNEHHNITIKKIMYTRRLYFHYFDRVCNTESKQKKKSAKSSVMEIMDYFGQKWRKLTDNFEKGIAIRRVDSKHHRGCSSIRRIGQVENTSGCSFRTQYTTPKWMNMRKCCQRKHTILLINKITEKSSATGSGFKTYTTPIS